MIKLISMLNLYFTIIVYICVANGQESNSKKSVPDLSKTSFVQPEHKVVEEPHDFKKLNSLKDVTEKSAIKSSNTFPIPDNSNLVEPYNSQTLKTMQIPNEIKNNEKVNKIDSSNTSFTTTAATVTEPKNSFNSWKELQEFNDEEKKKSAMSYLEEPYNSFQKLNFGNKTVKVYESEELVYENGTVEICIDLENGIFLNVVHTPKTIDGTEFYSTWGVLELETPGNFSHVMEFEIEGKNFKLVNYTQEEKLEDYYEQDPKELTTLVRR